MIEDTLLTTESPPISFMIFEDFSDWNCQKKDDHEVSLPSPDLPEEQYSKWQPWKGQNKPVNPLRGKQNRSSEAVQQAYLTRCCGHYCLNGFSLEEIHTARDTFWSLGREAQRGFIGRALRNSVESRIVVDGRNLCEPGWKTLHGVRDRRFRDIKAKVLKKITVPQDMKRVQPPSRRYLQAKTWMTDYVKLHCEKQPNKDEQHLPSCMSKEAVYSDYKMSVESGNECHLSYSMFKLMWARDFGFVKIAKGKGSHFQCTHCNNVKTAIGQLKLGKGTISEVRQMRKEHIDLQTLCRQKYYKHIKKAKGNPRKYCSIIIDNMDQSKTKLPRFTSHVKADVSLSTMQHHVTGVKCHGQQTHVFTWTDAVRGDCNVTLNCLMCVLLEVSKKNGNAMPETLYLQADNSGKDNKNNFVLIFLAMLVYTGIFKKVKLSFLMVGHTHEDVDTIFSRIGYQLNRQNAPTLPHLHDAIRNSHENPPSVEHLSSLWDFRTLCQESPCSFKGFQGVHHFVFKMVEGELKLKYKDWPEDEYKVMDITDAMTDLGRPPVVGLNNKIESVAVDMGKDLEKYAQAGRLEEDQLLWWRRYLGTVTKASRVRPISPLLTELPRYRPVSEVVEESNVVTALRQHIDKIRQTSTIRKTVKRK